MIVVVDTNVFVRERHLLRSGIGPLIPYFLGIKKGKLFIPGILRREYIEQATLTIREAAGEIKNKYERIHAIIGEAEPIDFPKDDEIKSAVEARLKELADVVTELPVTDDLILAAANRSLDKRPPTTAAYGLKDCMIWESILRLPAQSEVHLVTKDNGFFEGDEISPTLKDEGTQRSLNVVAHKDIGRVLQLLQDGTPPMDFEQVRGLLHDALHTRRLELMAQWHLEQLGPVTYTAFEPYFTAAHNVIQVEFKQQYDAVHDLVGNMGPNNLLLQFSGSFKWRAGADHLEELKLDAESLVGVDGIVLGQNYTLSAGTGALSFGGKRKSPYQNRGRLKQA